MKQAEIFLLNRYAASELAGALLLGRMARKTEDPYLRSKLTWHCAEEAKHAVIWENLIQTLNVPSFNLHDTTQKSYFSYADQATNIIDFLCFVHAYEHRVPFHFSLHKKWTQERRVKDALTLLIKEEQSHLSWIKTYLIKELQKNKKHVLLALQKFLDIEEKTYLSDLETIELMSEDGKSFAHLIRGSLPAYHKVLDDAVFQ